MLNINSLKKETISKEMNELESLTTDNQQLKTDDCNAYRDANTLTASYQASDIPLALLEKIEEAITHYPISRRSAALPLMHLWQNHFGYIDESGIEWIAAKLELQPIAILEIVTFYPWFRQAAPGKTIIRVCRTLSCAMAGSYELHDQLCKATGIDSEHHHGKGLPTSPDGKFSVEFVECLASCGTAPVCMINNDLIEKVTSSDIETIIAKHSVTTKVI